MTDISIINCKVANLRKLGFNTLEDCLKSNEKYLYIGRNVVYVKATFNSKWGNPYVVNKNNTRKQVLTLYEKHVRSNTDLLNSLHELEGKVLLCWCKPEMCHGDILVKLYEEMVLKIPSL